MKLEEERVPKREISVPQRPGFLERSRSDCPVYFEAGESANQYRKGVGKL